MGVNTTRNYLFIMGTNMLNLSSFLYSLSWCLFAATIFTACKNNKQETVSSEKFDAIAQNYAEIVLASYQDSYDEAVKLKNLIDDFVADPSEAKFEAAKNQWLQARIPYGQTEAYRFYGGPIDDEDGPEGLINAWPMDENFIDYVEGDSDAGLINDPATYPEITKEILTSLNEFETEESIFTGYHAIEFLLWGQDLYDDSPGRRPYTDYVTDGTGTASNQARRGEYLKTVADLLLDHLDAVKAEWEKDGAYRTAFLSLPKDKIVNNIFTALGKLSKGELSVERMSVAVELGHQEHEHSCFSDNTISDIEENLRGMVNVYTGTYKRVDGSTITGENYANVANALNPQKAQAVTTAIASAEQAIGAIPSPFDRAIIEDSQVILDAVTTLKDLSDAFADVAVELKK
ncbi:MAG: imelysin family protein [Bacteroidota bacterium]